MTNQEAMHTLKIRRPFYHDGSEMAQAIDMGVVALEFRTAKKVERQGPYKICPSCNNTIDAFECCPRCGQVLDWR